MSIHRRNIMKKLLGMLSALIVAALIVGCASTKPVSKVKVTSEQDSDGKLVITNTSGQEIVLFVNGIARKRIPETIHSSFRVAINDSDVKSNNNRRAIVTAYPIEIFKGNNFTLSSDNADLYVWNKQIGLSENIEWDISKSRVSEVLGGTKGENLAEAEFDFHFASNAKSYLVELYSDIDCQNRFVVGSLIPGDHLNAYKDPNSYSELTIYAKYIRNDGKGSEEIARGSLGSYIVRATGSSISIDVPAKPEDLINPTIFGAKGRLSDVATIIIENTKPYDKGSNNILKVSLDSANTKIENHPDLKNKIVNMSLIEPKTRQSYTLTVGTKGKSYKLFISEIASANPIQIYDLDLKGGEEYYISTPGIMPTGISTPDKELTSKELQRTVYFTSFEPNTKISYHVETSDKSIVVEKYGQISLGETTDEVSNSTLKKSITLPVKGMTYENSASVKIVFTAEKDGFISQIKSLNAQLFVDSVNGINLESFALESLDF